MPKGIYTRTGDNTRHPTIFTHCRICDVELDDTNRMWMRQNGRSYLRSTCKKCHNEGEKERQNRPDSYTKRPEHKLKQRNWNYSGRFGITLEEYDKLLQLQGGVCAICKEVCSSGRSLAVDHNHIMNEICGLLCGKCNRAIGYLKEDPNIIMNAYDYLEELHGARDEKICGLIMEKNQPLKQKEVEFVYCYECGEPVSNPVQTDKPIVVRAYVICPECLHKKYLVKTH